MKKILGVVITFNPDLPLLKKNIASFIEEVDSVIIVDNGSQSIAELHCLESDALKVLSNPSNLGIANGLNQALLYAQEKHFDFILTMDQDSYFENPTITDLLLGFQSDTTAIVCPSLKDMNSHHVDTVSEEYAEIFTTITSGCLCKVSILALVGGFDSKMFIDYVDFELCLRLQKKGFKIFRSQASVLCHHLGESKRYLFFGIPIISTNHSPLRRFYYARNTIYIYKKYFFTFPVFVLRDVLSFVKTILIILFFEKQKGAKIKMLIKGIWHGLFFM
nr:glycosyltransferase family 2 protein [uncultured Flavobacterium sp.]